MAQYVALKRLQVQELNPDGTAKLDGDGRPVSRVAMPGDPVPEAESWRNLDKYVRSGHIGLEGLGLTGPALAETIQRQRPRHPEGGRRVRRRKAAEKPAARAAEPPAPAPEEPETTPEPAETETEAETAAQE